MSRAAESGGIWSKNPENITRLRAAKREQYYKYRDRTLEKSRIQYKLNPKIKERTVELHKQFDMRRCGHCTGWFDSEDYLDHIRALKDQLRRRRLSNPFDDTEDEDAEDFD